LKKIHWDVRRRPSEARVQRADDVVPPQGGEDVRQGPLARGVPLERTEDPLPHQEPPLLLGQVLVGHDEDVDVESLRPSPDLDLDPRTHAGSRQSLEERAVLVPVRVEDEESGVLEDPEDGGVVPVEL
jgi:hypothetical protein